MIKKTLYFSNPAYLSLKQGQIVIKLPEIEKAGNVADIIKQQSIVTKPIEDIGILILDNRQITLTHALLNALLDNNSAVVTCNDKKLHSDRAFHEPNRSLRASEKTTLATNG